MIETVEWNINHGLYTYAPLKLDFTILLQKVHTKNVVATRKYRFTRFSTALNFLKKKKQFINTNIETLHDDTRLRARV